MADTPMNLAPPRLETAASAIEEERRQAAKDHFEELCAEEYSRLIALVRRRYPRLKLRTPESIVNSALKDGFSDILNRGKRFDTGEHFLKWLSRVVLNKASNAIRAEKTMLPRLGDLPGDETPDAIDPQLTPEKAAVYNELWVRVLDRLDEDEKLKAVFVRTLERASVEEIALELGVSTATVYRRLDRIHTIVIEEVGR